MGAVAVPAVLSPGTASAFVLLGAPELAAGYRQGLRYFEIEGRVGFDYLDAAFGVDGTARLSVHQKGMAQVGAYAGVGLVANSGARYYAKANFGYLGLRPRLGVVTSLQFTELVAGIFQIDIPVTIPLGSAGIRWVPTAGAGAEVHLGGNISGLLMGHVGLDAIKEPLGVTQYRPAWQVRLGLGFRLF